MSAVDVISADTSGQSFNPFMASLVKAARRAEMIGVLPYPIAQDQFTRSVSVGPIMSFNDLRNDARDLQCEAAVVYFASTANAKSGLISIDPENAIRAIRGAHNLGSQQFGSRFLSYETEAQS